MPPEKDLRYWEQRGENDDFLRRQMWYWRHQHAGTLKSQLERLRLRQAAEAEQQIADVIRGLGYQVYPTTPNCPFDLWVADEAGRAARVEVKLSTYHHNKGRGRYQADIRQRADCDLLVWLVRNGRDWHYVVPVGDLGQHRNIAIWSQCPANYRGRWSAYLEAWQHLHQAVANTHSRVWQFNLPLSFGSVLSQSKGSVLSQSKGSVLSQSKGSVLSQSKEGVA